MHRAQLSARLVRRLTAAAAIATLAGSGLAAPAAGQPVPRTGPETASSVRAAGPQTFDATNPRFGQPHEVTYDQYSLLIDGQRVPILGAEFHPYRLPSPRLWRDVLEKYKAGGFNTVSIYWSWARHSPAEDQYHFRGVENVDRLLTIAEKVGLYVIARPGPYINAEVDSGGLPGWLIRQAGPARTASPDYTAAWQEYFRRIDPIIAKHQITRGGNVIGFQIENELLRTEDKTPYMQALVDQVRADGIDVPTTTNAFLFGSSAWGGIVDLVGTDYYPNQFDCSHPKDWGATLQPQLDNMETENRAIAPLTPNFVPEEQGGAFDPWGGTGYQNCYRFTGPDFQRIFQESMSAQGVTMRSQYMVYGGTSWGWQAIPDNYSSYDYGAAINEARELTPKFYTLKKMMYAVAALGPLTMTDRTGTPAGSNDDLLYALRQNPDTGTQFIFLRHADPADTSDGSTTLSLTTGDGAYPRVPQKNGTAVQIHGRDMRMLVADYDLERQHLVYSTSELMTHARIGGRDVAVLYGKRGDAGETVLRYAKKPRVEVLSGKVHSHWDAERGDLRLNYSHRGVSRVLVHGDKGPLLLVLADGGKADRMWLTHTNKGPVLTYGPYLVRSAKLHRGVLALRGDTSDRFPHGKDLGGATDTAAWSGDLSRPGHSTKLRVLAAPKASTVTWNGSPVRRTKPRGAFAGTLDGPPSVSLPRLHWTFRTEAPERRLRFDDSRWTAADHLTTTNSNPPTSLPVLYMDDYGFHYGNVWYRGHFTATGNESSAQVDCAPGGGPSTCSVWLNGRFLRTISDSQTLGLPADALRVGKDNVLAVRAENNGHSQVLFTSNEQHKQPRGLRGVTINGAVQQPTWKIQGTVGGEHVTDKRRGPMNNGGLYGERKGWHLPSYDAASWRSVTLPHRSAGQKAGHSGGVSWYRSEFDLDLPKQADIPVGLRFADDPKHEYEVLIFVNGWMMGRYANDIGPQHLFTMPEGVLRSHGHNVLALAVLPRAADGSGGGLGKVTLQAYGRYATGR